MMNEDRQLPYREDLVERLTVLAEEAFAHDQAAAAHILYTLGTALLAGTDVLLSDHVEPFAAAMKRCLQDMQAKRN